MLARGGKDVSDTDGYCLLEFGGRLVTAKEAACSGPITMARAGGRIQAEPFAVFTRILLTSPSSMFGHHDSLLD